MIQYLYTVKKAIHDEFEPYMTFDLTMMGDLDLIALVKIPGSASLNPKTYIVNLIRIQAPLTFCLQLTASNRLR